MRGVEEGTPATGRAGLAWDGKHRPFWGVILSRANELLTRGSDDDLHERPAVPAAADDLVAACAELPAVLLRAAGLGGGHLDADGGAVVPGAGPDAQRDAARPHHGGPVPADAG